MILVLELVVCVRKAQDARVKTVTLKFRRLVSTGPHNQYAMHSSSFLRCTVLCKQDTLPLFITADLMLSWMLRILNNNLL